jgi:CheY-like chemotaxis protein
MKHKNSNPKHILLVEDEPLDVELMLVALRGNHRANRVVVVDNGAEAIEYLFRRGQFKKRPPGNPILVVLDNKMPKVGGLEVLKTIKADKHLKMIPVVVFTSSREKSDLVAFYGLGVNAYVVKPVDPSIFANVVKQIGLFWGVANEPPYEASEEDPRHAIADSSAQAAKAPVSNGKHPETSVSIDPSAWVSQENN